MEVVSCTADRNNELEPFMHQEEDAHTNRLEVVSCTDDRNNELEPFMHQEEKFYESKDLQSKIISTSIIPPILTI